MSTLTSHSETFLSRLFQEGVAVVRRDVGFDHSATCDQLLTNAYASATAGLLGIPPVDLAVAWDAARWLYGLCLLAADRSVGAEFFPEFLPPVLRCQSPAEILSADLTLRHLPDIWKLLHAANEEDPLLTPLLSLAKAVPLSSAGIPDLKNADLSLLEQHPAVWQIYNDRIC